MELKRAYLNLTSGETQDYHVRLSETVDNGIHAVYISGFSSACLDSELGACVEFTLSDVNSWMADYRHSEFWCMPAFGTSLKEIPSETQGLIYKKEDGRYGVVLPVVSDQYKCVLEGLDDDTVNAKLFSWCDDLVSCEALAFLWAEGDDPFSLLEMCVQIGLKLLGTGYRTRAERRYPDIFEYLGWCSWDAFEIRVNEDSLLAKFQEFKDKKIPVKWAIIDDMWAEVRDFYGKEYKTRQEMFRLMHSSKLHSFHADPYRFPHGLKGCIDKIKDYGITVGMWHPTTGYWMGIDPEGETYDELKDCLIQTADGRLIHSPQQHKAYQFYNTFHDYLKQSGAEFVKIDNQSMTRRFFKKYAPVGQVARQFHDAMEASVGQHFDNQMINCMGMASEDMWNRSTSPISRCSDDFLPENRAWFTKHILQCAYNCLIQGQFYHCDWDMWWTDDGQAEKNSILRSISGGPIYISDTLGRSRAEILKPLVLEDGRILRCERPAMPTKDCLTHDPLTSNRLFKLQNKCEESGVLAVFNLDEANRPVSGTVSPIDVAGLEGDEFAVYEHFSKEMRILKASEQLHITLDKCDDYRLYILVPMKEGNAVIGRTDKFISPATVKCSHDGHVELVESGPYAYVENRVLILKEG